MFVVRHTEDYRNAIPENQRGRAISHSTRRLRIPGPSFDDQTEFDILSPKLNQVRIEACHFFKLPPDVGTVETKN